MYVTEKRRGLGEPDVVEPGVCKLLLSLLCFNMADASYAGFVFTPRSNQAMFDPGFVILLNSGGIGSCRFRAQLPCPTSFLLS